MQFWETTAVASASSVVYNTAKKTKLDDRIQRPRKHDYQQQISWSLTLYPQEKVL